MSATLAGFGLKPAYHPSGTLRPAIYPVASGYATGILTRQPVKLTTAGVIEAAAVGDLFIGTFMGVSWKDADGRQQFSPQWTASTAGTDIQAVVTLDAATIYQIQANATLAVTATGLQYDFAAASGSTATGLSSMVLDVASTANNASMQVIGLNAGPDNAWGDAFPIVQVRISEHQLVANIVGF